MGAMFAAPRMPNLRGLDEGTAAGGYSTYMGLMILGLEKEMSLLGVRSRPVYRIHTPTTSFKSL